MKIITDKEIENICLTILNRAINEKSKYSNHIYFLYNCGCRLGEVFNFRIKLHDDINKVIIYPQKKNKPRTISITDNRLNEILFNMNSYNEIGFTNYKGLQRELKRLAEYSDIKNGKKNISAHLFRHNYIRKLNNKGLTISQINKELGYTNQSVSNTYLGSCIYI